MDFTRCCIGAFLGALVDRKTLGSQQAQCGSLVGDGSELTTSI